MRHRSSGSSHCAQAVCGRRHGRSRLGTGGSERSSRPALFGTTRARAMERRRQRRAPVIKAKSSKASMSIHHYTFGSMRRASGGRKNQKEQRISLVIKSSAGGAQPCTSDQPPKRRRAKPAGPGLGATAHGSSLPRLAGTNRASGRPGTTRRRGRPAVGASHTATRTPDADRASWLASRRPAAHASARAVASQPRVDERQ